VSFLKELQEKALKLTHQAEELQTCWRQDLFSRSGLEGTADQVRSEAYNLLDKTNEFLETVEQRGQMLSQSIQFFRVANAALTKLDQLEVQLAAHQAAPGSAQLAQLHSQVARALEDATAPALHHGYSLLDQAGRSHPGTEVSHRNGFN
jgi:chromosome segregation ATPase